MMIRNLTPDDHKEAVRLAKTSPYTKDFSNRVMFSSDAAYAKGWIRGLLDTSGAISGFYCVRQKTRVPETMLYFIVVAPEARSRGVGKLLLDDMKARSPSGKIALNVMKENRAVQFYLREGFVVVGDSLGGKAHRMEWTRC